MSDGHHFLPEDFSGNEDDNAFNGSFHAVYKCYSTAFLTDRERTDVENGGKILLPQTALEQLVEETRIMLFKLKNPKYDQITHCGVLEFLPTQEPSCYLPHWMMDHLALTEGDELHVQSINYLPTATFVRFQPQSIHFLDITNPKAVLEKVLRNFSCLTRGDMISINYLNRNYQLSVLELKPSNAVTIIECDMEVDFAPPIGYVEPKSIPIPENDQQSSSKPTSYKNPTSFMPFHGQGNRLNGKMKTNNKEERQQQQQEIPQTRGIPNHEYKYGLLQFIRVPLRSVNDDMNEILDKNSPNRFQPFTGEGKILKQPRNQKPK